MSDIFGKISIEPEKPNSSHKRAERKQASSPPRRQKYSRPFQLSNMIWLMIPVGLVALYSILGFWGVPYYIKNVATEQFDQKYNLTLLPGKITFNPFSFTLRSDSTTLSEQEGKNIAYLKHLEFNFAAIPLLRMDLVCNKVKIDSPSINLIRHANGTYNISSLLPDIGEASDETGMMGFSGLPFLFSLNNISITNGTLVFDDQPKKKIHKIQEIDLQLPTLSNIAFQADSYITPHFSAIVNGSPVSLKGKSSSQATSQTKQLSWELKNFLLQDYVSYLPFELPFNINKGIADGVLELRFNNHDTQEDKLTISFNLSIADIDFETQQKRLQLNASKMNVAGSFIPIKRLVNINKLNFDSPDFTAKTSKLLQEIGEIFLLSQEKSDQLIPVEKPVVFSLHSVQFKNGKLTQISGAGEEKQIREWTELQLNISNYITDEAYKPADHKPSILAMSGHTKENNNTFSYIGTFESPTAISGELSIDNMTSQSLFAFILPGENTFTSQGSGTLNAIFTFSNNSDDKQPNVAFSKADIRVKNIEIRDMKGSIITGDELSLIHAHLDDKSKNLGNIRIKNGKLFYTRENNPAIFSKITSGQYSFSKLDYDGKITIHPTKRNQPPFTLKNASIQYSSIDVSEEKSDNIVLSGITSTAGKVSATGYVNLDPFKMVLSTTFNGVKSKTTSALLPHHSFISQTEGDLSGKGSFTFPQTAFTGDLILSNGRFSKNKDQTLSWDELKLENIHYTAQPYHLGVQRVALNKPQMTASIQDQNDSIPDHCISFLRNTLNKKNHPSFQQKKISISPLDIQKIAITNGQVGINDQRLTPAWTGLITDLEGTITGIHSTNPVPKSLFNFTGTLDGSDFRWTGTSDPFKNTKTDKYQLHLTNYPLTQFSTQLRPLSDINFKSATISLNLSSDWQSGLRSYSVNSTLSHLKAGSLDSDSALPLAILTDHKGDVQINFSNLQSTTSTYSSLFDSLIGNFQKRIIKGSLSPLLLTTSDYSDLIDNEFIDFKPGQFMLSDTGRKTLGRYGALLVAHPNIKLSLSGGISPVEDRENLHNQLEKHEKDRVEKENTKLFAKWQQKKKEYELQVNNKQDKAISEGLVAESDIPKKVLAGFRPLLPEPVIVDNEMLLELAEKRLDIVRQHFITQLSLDKGRVEIIHQPATALSRNVTDKWVHIEILPFQSPMLF